ncbi:methylated-DNA--[protein]-cysteine S-methyltransferase [Bradyrhizobium canariense]|uniref:Methylated-DNA-[protein]-cysteine S-methyltransferase n=1 Tax=Bradyrhizobium canariense TaxID=255045 RepID=A0A1H1UDW2_9BRAD|nr:methylated-DNA--[protein]-cysteine S-methyltransferase [Bradyrhizobium canariense]SDS70481.1 methylated-DNA-[protein]-cysteine S-methyltransferase [Bradyrhizobium canariense]
MSQSATQKYALFDTAIGRCGIAWNDIGVLAVRLPFASDDKMRAHLRNKCGDLEEAAPPPHIRLAIDAITSLMNGEAVDLSGIDLDMARVPDFDRRVYEIARSIPPGSTLTYGDIAKRLGGLELARDVGQALGHNPFAIVVPCHRVLAAGGKPGGFSAPGGRSTKLRMLAIENAYVNDTPSLFDFSKRQRPRQTEGNPKPSLGNSRRRAG